MKKKIKRGQALIETMIVLSLYFFMIGFLISSFQAMYNKMVLTVAAYEYARTTVAYESSERYSGNSSAGIYAYGLQAGKEKAQSVIKNSALATKMLHIDEHRGYNVYGLNAHQKESTVAFNSRMHSYAQATIEGKMDYLFPIISPDLSGIISDGVNFKVSFTMSKERIWNA